jgi:hypothetical protein
MLYYSHFVVESSLTTFRFLTDLQLLYLDAVDNFLNYGSLDRRPFEHGAVDHGLLDRDPVDHALLNPEPLDLEPRGLEPLDSEPLDLKPLNLEPVGLEPIGLEPIGGPEPLDQGPIDHPPASVPAPIDQDNFAPAVMAAAVMPVMSEPRLALIDGGKIDGGKSDSLDGPSNEGELEPIQNGRTDAQASDRPDVQDGRQQNRQETANRENGWINKTAATVVAVAAGAALFETALLPGLALGVAAIAAPKYVSRLARAITPMFKSTIRATYQLAKKPGEAFAEAQHQINDIIAEVRAEDASHAGIRAVEVLRAAA